MGLILIQVGAFLLTELMRKRQASLHFDDYSVDRVSPLLSQVLRPKDSLFEPKRCHTVPEISEFIQEVQKKFRTVGDLLRRETCGKDCPIPSQFGIFINREILDHIEFFARRCHNRVLDFETRAKRNTNSPKIISEVFQSSKSEPATTVASFEENQSKSLRFSIKTESKKGLARDEPPQIQKFVDFLQKEVTPLLGSADWAYDMLLERGNDTERKGIVEKFKKWKRKKAQAKMKLIFLKSVTQTN